MPQLLLLKSPCWRMAAFYRRLKEAMNRRHATFDLLRSLANGCNVSMRPFTTGGNRPILLKNSVFANGQKTDL